MAGVHALSQARGSSARRGAPLSDLRTSTGRCMACKQEAIAPLWICVSIPMMELEGPSETFGSNAPCICRKEIWRGQVHLPMIVQLDGVQIEVGCWLFGSLTGPVGVFVLILHNGPPALLGVEVNLEPLLPAVQIGTLGHCGLR